MLRNIQIDSHTPESAAAQCVKKTKQDMFLIQVLKFQYKITHMIINRDKLLLYNKYQPVLEVNVAGRDKTVQ